MSLLIVLGSFKVQAQEFNFLVTISDKQLQAQSTGREVFTQMQKRITDFLNSRRWTNDYFEPHERINGKLNITLVSGDIASGNFTANAQIQASRTVYNTNYETLFFSYVDRNFNFVYQETQPFDLNFNENTYVGDLSSMLGYYAYIILATYYDSFAPLGGSTWIDKAFQISLVAQNSSANWGNSDTRNRIWLVENLQSQQLSALREAFYTYHREALDNYLQKKQEAKTKILEMLKSFEQVNRLRPSSLLLNIFLDAKYLEMIQMFKEGNKEQRQQVYDLLIRLDPPRLNLYKQIINNP